MIQAAGGVLWRHASGGRADIQIAVVHRPRYDDWSLPKGKLEPGEHPLLGAVREVAEETGHTARVGRRLPSTSYPVGGDPKTVDYWAMQDSGGSFTAGDEVDDLRWLTPEAARSLLTNAHDAGVFDALLAAPYDTAALLVVRHGRAGNPDSWSGEDAQRPLDETGCQQAECLADLLPVYHPTRVLTADRVRCVDTVRPLAQRLGLRVEVAWDFSEESHAEDPSRMARRLRSLAASGDPVVVCSQGGVIPDTVILLAEQDQVPLPAQAARKGSVWALHVTAKGHLVAADYYPRPTKPTAPEAVAATTPAADNRS